MDECLKLISTSACPEELQLALMAVIDEKRFENMTISQTVGVIEFLKWNLINRSEL